MHSRTIPTSVLFLTLLLASAGNHAAAGIRMVSRATGDGLTGAQILRLADGKLRMDLDEPASMSVIYTPKTAAGKEARLTHLDHVKKKYVRMTESQLRKMGGNVQQLQTQASSLLAALPPELRQQAEAVMGTSSSRAAPAAEETIQLKPTERKDTVGKYACEIFAGTAKTGTGKTPRREEVCVARLEALGIPGLKASEFQAMGDLAKLYSSLSGSFGLPRIPRLDPLHSAEIFGFEGFPVRVRQLEGSKVVSETVLEDLRRETVAPREFTLPGNYKKQGLTELVTEK